MTDYTPDGKEIKTSTIWLSFAEGDVPLTLDLTEFHYQLGKAQEALERHQRIMARRKLLQDAVKTFFDFEESMEKVRRLSSRTPEEIAEMSKRIKELGQ